jgi:hypothetical protein
MQTGLTPAFLLTSDPKHIVIDSLKGLVGQNCNIRLNEEYKGESSSSQPPTAGLFSVRLDLTRPFR